MRKNGYHWLKYLSSDEQNRFKRNLTKEWYLDDVYATLDVFIGGAFVWGDTREGHIYWEHIAYRKESLVLAPIKQIKEFKL